MASKLFSIPLLGRGTSDVESLASYIHRMAYEHGIGVGELFRFCSRNMPAELNNKFAVANYYIDVGEIIRVNDTSDMLLEVFENMTGQNLRAGSLTWMRHIITRMRGEIYPGFRWCPECFSEMEALDEPTYFKLIWNFESVSHCLVHRTELIKNCEHCGSDQSTYRKRAPMSVCQECGQPLSKRKKRLTSTELQPSWIGTGTDIAYLLRDISREGSDDFCPEKIRMSLSKVFDHYWDSDNEQQIYRLLGRDRLLAFIHRQRPISFRPARIISHKLGISLFTLLSGNAEYSSSVLDAKWFCNLPPGYLESTKKRRNDHMKIINKIAKVTKQSENPLSLKELAKKVDVSVGYLEYRHPVLVANIVSEHKKFIAQEKQKKIQVATAKALEQFARIEESKINSMKEQVAKNIHQETGLSKTIVKNAVEAAYKANYLN